MAPSSFTDPPALDSTLQAILLKIASESISYGMQHRHAPMLDTQSFAPPLQRHAATFVSLYRASNLRGCIGRLDATRPLVIDIAENAYAAAYLDPRFTPLADNELSDLEIIISILSPSRQLAVTQEKELYQRLRPGIDGLILQDGSHRATFLPSVWPAVNNDPVEFVSQLKRKAGLASKHWSATIRFETYSTWTFSNSAAI